MAFLRVFGRVIWLVALLAFGAGALLLLAGPRADPPWAPLDLGAEPGRTTAGKLAALDGDPLTCARHLERAGIRYARLAARAASATCGYEDGVAWSEGGSRTARYAPGAPALACPLAAGLATWEWSVVQPAAARLLGTTVTAIEHYGTYSCRRLYGRASGGWSEHARAAAIDVAAFRLADGRRITVLGGWKDGGPEAAFLRAVRDGGCRIFATTLSPDYNPAHRDHLHLDQARRGTRRTVCR